MSKDPAFLFYPNDYIGGTMGMTFEEKGAYIELLMMQFNRGHMTSHMCGQVVGHLWESIQHKFRQDESGLWYNERLDIEKEKRLSFTNSRRNNLKGVNQYTKNQSENKAHMTTHMENVNDNINEVTSLKKVSRKKTVELSDASAEIMDWFISEFDNVAYDWSASAKTKARQGIDYAIKRLQNKPENKELNFDELVCLLKMTITFIKKDNFWHDKLESPAKLMTSDKSGLNWLDRFVAMYRSKSPELKQQVTIDEVGRNVAEWIKGKEERERAEKEKIY